MIGSQTSSLTTTATMTLSKSTRALLAITPLYSFRLHEGGALSLGPQHSHGWCYGEHPQPLAMTGIQKSSLAITIIVTLSKSTRALLAITPLSSFRLHEGGAFSLGLMHVPD